MARGKNRVQHLGIPGTILSDKYADWSFIYDAATSTKNPLYNIGDRVVLPDGRVFRYAKSGGDCYTYQLCMFYGQRISAYTALLANQAVGDKQIYIDAGSAAAVAADELRGGYVLIYGTDNSDCQQRGIIGNTLADSDGYTYIYLDAPLNVVLTATTSAAAVMRNPYASVLTVGSTTYTSAAGLPAVEATASGQYLWIQTWGPCAVAPGEAAICDIDYERSVCVDVTCGALHEGGDSGYGTGACQYVGFGLERNAAGGGVVWIMLQISP